MYHIDVDVCVDEMYHIDVDYLISYFKSKVAFIALGILSKY